ncbi:MAG: DUF3179 domain-containing protein [Spirochaetales bacterium]
MRRLMSVAILTCVSLALFAGGGAETPQQAELLETSVPSYPGFSTDFSRTTVDPAQILSGGPPKDGIPAIDNPRFVSVGEADEWLEDDEPVFIVSANGRTKLYPVQILTYHEIVNDVVGETPVAVTYCPLCNTGITFERQFDGQVLDFGTTGRLRFSNLLMYDRQTESWWQQATGEGVIGEYAGYELELYPMLMAPWELASQRYTGAQVLSRETGHSRPYGNNPYAGYDTATRPFLYQGPNTPTGHNPMTRVVQVVQNGETLAVPYPDAQELGVVQETVGGEPVVVFWQPGTNSALDARQIAAGRDVGTANAFRAQVDGQALRFERTPEGFIDQQTGSVWDATGTATDGPLAGTQLEPLVQIQHFWFSYTAFATDERWQER